MNRPTDAAVTVEMVLDDFDDAGIEYCVLRNFEFIEGEPIDGDVDVLVRKRDQNEIQRILSRNGFRSAEGDTTQQTVFLRFLPQAKRLLAVDLYWDAPTYNGLPLLDGERTLRGRRRLEGISVPAEEDYFVELVFHPALNKNRYRDHYRSELDRLRSSVDGATVRDHAKALFGDCGVDAVNYALNGKYEDVLAMKPSLITAGLRRVPKLGPRFVWNLLIRREIIDPLQRTGRRLSPFYRKPVIALLGPDGAGKTTVTRELEDVLSENGFDPGRYELGVYNGESVVMRFGKMVDSVFGSGQASSGQAEETEPTDLRLSSTGSPWRSIVHLLDIGIRQIRAELSGHSTIVADRYAHDIAVYNDPGPVESLLSPFEREPFYPIILEGNPETLALRSEYDADSIREMQDCLGRFDFPQIDASCDPDSVVQAALEQIFDDGDLLKASSYLVK